MADSRGFAMFAVPLLTATARNASISVGRGIDADGELVTVPFDLGGYELLRPQGT